MTHQTILVTGATGLLGRHVVPLLEQRFSDRTIMAVGSEAGDLSRLDHALGLIRDTRPDCIVHLAAYGGGQEFNRAWTADCLFQNASMTLNLYEAASQNGVKKIVYPVSFDSYPARCLSPVAESQLWAGYNPANYAGHAIGKRLGAAAADVYRYQYGMDSAVLILGELYGEQDNFRAQETATVASIIRCMTEAERSGLRKISLPASDDVLYDLAYAGDVAALIPWFIDNDSPRPVNVSQGVGYSVSDIIEAVREATGYRVEVDLTEPSVDALSPHLMNVSALAELGLSCPTPLKTGIKRTVQWYLNNLDAPKHGFRA
ncbi:NAD-dependent epimerase/dehydratase family protein [Caulobacter sp. DWR2-3-1b2]|uniref:NAD-dependent epimerase/dehydratase family protein n=1 Tax=unclassified Caulobacter TaxID=2648921 RepID=UPI003CF685B0